MAKRKVTANDDAKVFTVRVPKELWAAAMQERLATGDSLNTIIVSCLDERYPETSKYMRLAQIMLEED